MTAVGENLCEESDVVTHYRVILGRDPESAAVVEEAKRQPLIPFVRDGFDSGEFQDFVVSRLANGRRIPHERLSARPTPHQISWLARHLELGSGRRRSWTPRNMGRLLPVPLRRRLFSPAGPGLAQQRALAALPRRLLRPPSGATEESGGSEQTLPRQPRRDPEMSGGIVIVTGMHRSGTSLCANLMSLLGVNMSDEIEPTPDNPSGHWERPELARYHDRILRTLGRGWRDMRHALALPPDWLSRPEVQTVKDDIKDWLDGRLGSGAAARLQGSARRPACSAVGPDLRRTGPDRPLRVLCAPPREGRPVFGQAGRNARMTPPIGGWFTIPTQSEPLATESYASSPMTSGSSTAALLRRLASFLGLNGSLDNETLKDLMIHTIDPGLRHDASSPEPDTVATALYRHLLESGPLGRFSIAAREASKAFAAVDEFMQPLLDAAYAERAGGKEPDSAGSGRPFDMDMVRLAARLAANVKLHTEALGSVLDKLEAQSKRSAAVGDSGAAERRRGCAAQPVLSAIAPLPSSGIGRNVSRLRQRWPIESKTYVKNFAEGVPEFGIHKAQLRPCAKIQNVLPAAHVHILGKLWKLDCVVNDPDILEDARFARTAGAPRSDRDELDI